MTIKTSVFLPADLAEMTKNPEFSAKATRLLKDYLSGKTPLPTPGPELRSKIFSAKTAAENEICNDARLSEVAALGASLVHKLEDLRKEYTGSDRVLSMLQEMNSVAGEISKLGINLNEVFSNQSANSNTAYEDSTSRICQVCSTKMKRKADGIGSVYCPRCGSS